MWRQHSFLKSEILTAQSSKVRNTRRRWSEDDTVLEVINSYKVSSLFKLSMLNWLCQRITELTYIIELTFENWDRRRWSAADDAYEWVMSHMNESCLVWTSHVTHEWVMSHMSESCLIWMSHVSYESVMSHMSESYFYKSVISHTNESCLTWMSHVSHGRAMHPYAAAG